MKIRKEKLLALLLSLCLAVSLLAGCGESTKDSLQSPSNTAWTLESVTYHFFPDGALVIWLGEEVFSGVYLWNETDGTAIVDGESLGLKMEKKGLSMEGPDGKYVLMEYAGVAGGERDSDYETFMATPWQYENVAYAFRDDGTVDVYGEGEQPLIGVGRHYWNCDADRGILILDGALAAQMHLEGDHLALQTVEGISVLLAPYTGTLPD